MKTTIFLHAASTTLMIAFFFHLASAQNSFPTPTGACLLDATGVAAGNGGELRLAELDANGANYVGWKAPDKLTGDQLYVFPDGFPSGSGKVLSSDNTGVLSWVKRAKTDLSNLETITLINAALLPNANNTLDLGSGVNSWRNIYFDGAIYLDDVKFISNAGTTSVFIGSQAGNSNTGTTNSGFGYQAMFSNTTGDYNTADGYQALYSNTIGLYNTASGYRSMYSNTTGDYNAALGASSLTDNTTGFENTAIGYATLNSNTTGNENTALGFTSLAFNTTGSGNTALGTLSMPANTAGDYNTASGFASMSFNTTGSRNTAFGAKSLDRNTTGYYNTASGYESLHSNTTGYDNTANGYQALYSSTTAADNTANGYQALYSNTTGTSNTANGHQALYSNTTGTSNTANGYQALYSNTTGTANAANGHQALYSNTTGSWCTAVGSLALYENASGNYNTAFGRRALENTDGSSNNTAVGYSAGDSHDNGNSNTFIGYSADANAGAYTNSTALGNTSSITASNQVRIGNTAITSIGGYEPWTDLSDNRFKKQIQENVPGLEFINKLKPVTYHLDVTGLRKFLGEDITGEEGTEGFAEISAEHQASIDESVKKKEQIVYTGFIAQQVEASAKELNYDFSGVDAPQNEHSLYGLRYSQFVVPLVKAVQELDLENGKLKIENGELKDQITKLNEAVFGSKMNSGSVEIKSSTFGKDLEGALLGQNIPNPFDNSTLIPFRIPKDCNDASIMVVEQGTGRVVTVIPITCDETHVQIHAGTLASGMYSYTLYVDGKMIDTKQMELLK